VTRSSSYPDVVLTDFGIAAIMDGTTSITQTKLFLPGTPLLPHDPAYFDPIIAIGCFIVAVIINTMLVVKAEWLVDLWHKQA
jgi:hypothetical protein